MTKYIGKYVEKQVSDENTYQELISDVQKVQQNNYSSALQSTMSKFLTFVKSFLDHKANKDTTVVHLTKVEKDNILSTVSSVDQLEELNQKSRTMIDEYKTLNPVAVARGGTGADNAAEALSNLGLTATADELNYCAGVDSEIQPQIDNKVDKIEGKQLSTNDFSNSDKEIVTNVPTQLANKSNIDHTHSAISGLIATVEELNYSHGVTSNIQTQLNSTAKIDYSTISKCMIGFDSGYPVIYFGDTYRLDFKDDGIHFKQKISDTYELIWFVNVDKLTGDGDE